MLTEAKKQIQHGGWLPWVAANLSFGDRQARKYMQISDAKDAIESNRNSGADLTINGILEMLSSPKPNTPADDQVPNWNGTVEEVAERFGISLAEALLVANKDGIYRWVTLNDAGMEIIRTEIDDPIGARQHRLEYPPMTEAQWCTAMVRRNDWARLNGRPFSTDEELAAEHELPLEMVLAASRYADLPD